MAWYAVHINSTLLRDFTNHLLDIRIQPYVPLQTFTLKVRHVHRPVTVRKPLFPGYVFVPDTAPLHQVARTRGFFSFVRMGAGPATVADTEIEALRDLEEDGAFTFTEQRLHPGQRVTLAEGVLQGMTGTIRRIFSKAGADYAELTMHGGAGAVKVPACLLQGSMG